MKCSKCGREIDDNIEYCPYCGNKLRKSKSNLLDKLKYLFFEFNGMCKGWRDHNCYASFCYGS